MATKVLIIRFSSIGDIVLTTPVIRCLKKQLKQVELHYLTKSTYTPLLKANPYIDKIHGLDGSLSSIINELKKEKFDYIIDLHNNLRTARVKAALKTKSGSFRKLNIQKWLTVNLKMDVLPKIHIVDRYLATAAKLEIYNDDEGLDYFIPAEDEVEPPSLPPEFSTGYIGLVIGAKFTTKAMPTKKIITICNAINKPILLLGGPEDHKIGEEITQNCPGALYNACGKYNINQSASLVRQADSIISHDTGLMHIAAAFKKDVISVWGNTIPQFGMTPYLPTGKGSSKIIEAQDLNCRPCSKLGFNQCPKKHFNCMNLIENQEIINAAT